MIEGGGLGVFEPTEIGPIDVQRANGVVDIVVADEAEAVAVAKRYLSYFQGRLDEWECADQALLRDVVPADRLRSYDVRRAVELLFDTGSVLELRRDFGLGMITALARIEGRPVGVIANNPTHLAGAIDTPGADKVARFMQLCDAFDLPIITLCDTPGMMVGPDVEATALVRHCNRLFVTGANLTVPTVTIVLRKAYGLGAQAMMGGSTKAPLACVAWPTGEFGGMGLEGAVRLGYRRELDAAGDPEAREELFQELVDRMYQIGKALSVASYFEIDDVIDPADTRRWITALLDVGAGAAAPRRQEAPEHRHLVTGARRRADGAVRPWRRGVRVSPSPAPSSWRPASGSASPPSRCCRSSSIPHDAVVVALGAGHVHEQLPGVDRAPRRRPRRRRADARRRRGRPADRPARVPPRRRPLAGHRHRRRRARRRRGHRQGPRPAPRRARARRRRRRAVRRADDVGRRQRPAARVRAAGPALRPATLPGHDHDGLRRPRRRQRRRLRRDGRDRPGRPRSPSPSPCRASALGAAAGIALRRHLDARRFRRLVLALLTVAGISALAAALSS